MMPAARPVFCRAPLRKGRSSIAVMVSSLRGSLGKTTGTVVHTTRCFTVGGSAATLCARWQAGQHKDITMHLLQFLDCLGFAMAHSRTDGIAQVVVRIAPIHPKPKLHLRIIALGRQELQGRQHGWSWRRCHGAHCAKWVSEGPRHHTSCAQYDQLCR